MRIFEILAIVLILSSESYAQMIAPCPEAGFTTLDTPKLIFPVQPVVGQPWYICYKSPGSCQSPSSNTTPIQITGSTIEIRKSFSRVSFGICPLPFYLKENLPAPTQAGPISLKYFWRRGLNDDAVLAAMPFELQEQSVIHVLATDEVQQLPALDLKTLIGLALLLPALGCGAIRRFGSQRD